MKTQQLYEDTFLKILWDDGSSVIAVYWKEATSSMTGDEFKKELTLFAGHVEAKRAHEILTSPVFGTSRDRTCRNGASKIFLAVTTPRACGDSRSCFPKAPRFRR